MRLHELTLERIEEWRKRRAEVGREKYGDAHLQRYGMVDIMEELLDIENLINLHYAKIEDAGYLTDPVWEQLHSLECAIKLAKQAVIDLDRRLPDHLCTDEQGGDRIWISEQAAVYKPCATCGETPAWCGCGEAEADD